MTPLALLPALLKLWLPVMLFFALMVGSQTINTLMVGCRGDAYALAGVGLANMMQNCFCLAMVNSIGSGMDTLVSQAHGAGEFEVTAHYLQRCRAILLLNYAWMYPLLYFSSTVLGWIGQDPLVAQHACSYNRASLWGLIPWGQSTMLCIYLRNRGHPKFAAFVTLLCFLLHPIWAVTLIHVLNLGNTGAGWANSVTWWLMYILLAAYAHINSKKLGVSTWSLLGIGAPGLEGWYSYMEVALPAFCQGTSEMWFWEVISPFAGLIGTDELAAQVALVNIVYATFIPCGSLGMAGATLMGTAIGEGSPKKASNMSVLILSITVGVSVCIMLTLSLGASAIAKMFTPDAVVESLITRVLRYWGFVTLWKSQFLVMGAMLRGIGLVGLASMVTCVAYWAVSFPLFIFIGFVMRLGFYWMWIGVGLGPLVALPFYVYAYYYMDFQAMVERAKKDSSSSSSRSSSRS